jgi:hypothetical protein
MIRTVKEEMKNGFLNEDDKQKAIDGFQFTACFDLHILIAPDGKVSSFYY